MAQIFRPGRYNGRVTIEYQAVASPAYRLLSFPCESRRTAARRRRFVDDSDRIGCHIGFFDTTVNSPADLRCESLLKPAWKRGGVLRLRVYVAIYSAPPSHHAPASLNQPRRQNSFKIEFKGWSKLTAPLFPLFVSSSSYNRLFNFLDIS